MKNNIHGIDHIGLTVPNIESATQFFIQAFDAIILYDTLKTEKNDKETQKRLGIKSDMTECAIRMISLPNGPSLELFEFKGASQKPAITPADLGWTHIGIYVDDIETAIDKVKKAGGSINAPAIPLAGLEAGDGNFFCYTKTPWGSTIELLSYPSRQSYLDHAPRRKWRV